jgi:hypothetical protein
MPARQTVDAEQRTVRHKHASKLAPARPQSAQTAAPLRRLDLPFGPSDFRCNESDPVRPSVKYKRLSSLLSSTRHPHWQCLALSPFQITIFVLSSACKNQLAYQLKYEGHSRGMPVVTRGTLVQALNELSCFSVIQRSRSLELSKPRSASQETQQARSANPMSM